MPTGQELFNGVHHYAAFVCICIRKLGLYVNKQLAKHAAGTLLLNRRLATSQEVHIALTLLTFQASEGRPDKSGDSWRM